MAKRRGHKGGGGGAGPCGAVGGKSGSQLTGHPVPKTACAACRDTQASGSGGAGARPAPAPRTDTPRAPHRYRGCSDVSEGDRSGMESDVEDRVVAMEAVVASSKDGGVQGRRSGRPAGRRLWALPQPFQASGSPCSLAHPQQAVPRPTCHPTLHSARRL